MLELLGSAVAPLQFKLRQPDNERINTRCIVASVESVQEKTG